MNDSHRFTDSIEWSDELSDSPRRQSVLMGFAVLGFVAAGVIYYVRHLQEEPASPPPPNFQVAANVKEYNPRTVVRPFKPITDAKFIKASEVQKQVSDNELVLGISINGQARAYPINMLVGPRREIINDTVGNRAIAGTW